MALDTVALLGSLYPAARQQGISSQDMRSRAYRHLIAAFRRAFVRLRLR